MSGFSLKAQIGDPERRNLDLARVLLIHGELAPRLALQTLLEAGGYAVDVAATPAEGLSKLDEGRYALVLTDSKCCGGSAQTGRGVLAYARAKEYRPATAVVTSAGYEPDAGRGPHHHQVSIHTQGVPHLLADIADLIALRASRRHRA
jgi:CheY-like chemotaxis protein